MTIAVIGAGASGTLIAARLLMQAQGDRILLFSKDGTIGRGVAYGTAWSGHLLNVPTGRMSALPEAPDHFLRFLAALPPVESSPGTAPEAGSFAPRSVYGLYLRNLLDTAETNAFDRGGRLERRRQDVVALEEAADGVHLATADGDVVVVDRVVLAFGNQPPTVPTFWPSDPEARRSHPFIANPWAPGELERIPRGGRILVVGRGLTMVDVVLWLTDRTRNITFHTLSRRGLLPQSHRTGGPHPPSARAGAWPLAQSARALTRLVRQAIAEDVDRGGDWRDVVDSLRPQVQALWRALPLPEQRRFMRHVRAYWDVARHRVAPSIGARVDELLHAGVIIPERGRVESFEPLADGRIRARLTSARAGDRDLVVDAVVNCTGPEEDLTRAGSPLVAHLLARRYAQRHPTGMGFRAAPDGALLGEAGQPSSRLFTLGPPRRGELWETTAMPEIRGQAAALAARLVSGSGGREEHHES